MLIVTNQNKTEVIPTCYSIFLTDDLCVVIRRGPLFYSPILFSVFGLLVFGNLDFAFWKIGTTYTR